MALGKMSIYIYIYIYIYRKKKHDRKGRIYGFLQIFIGKNPPGSAPALRSLRTRRRSPSEPLSLSSSSSELSFMGWFHGMLMVTSWQIADEFSNKTCVFFEKHPGQKKTQSCLWFMMIWYDVIWDDMICNNFINTWWGRHYFEASGSDQ